jgi:hypothetical protein
MLGSATRINVEPSNLSHLWIKVDQYHRRIFILAAMPTLQNITVHVTVDGSPLKEWGTRTLRNKTVFCYIESETNKRFEVSIKPKIPYISKDGPAAHGFGTRHRGKERPGYFGVANQWEGVDGDEGC